MKIQFKPKKTKHIPKKYIYTPRDIPEPKKGNKVRVFKKTPRLERNGTRYPWETWFSQPEFTLRRGIDYHVRTDTMAQQIRNKGRGPQYQCRVSIRIHEDMNGLTVSLR